MNRHCPEFVYSKSGQCFFVGLLEGLFVGFSIEFFNPSKSGYPFIFFGFFYEVS